MTSTALIEQKPIQFLDGTYIKQNSRSCHERCGSDCLFERLHHGTCCRHICWIEAQAGMQTRNIAVIGPRYWAALALASVFGTNMGDFVAAYLGLGHVNGLLPMTVVFVFVLGAEHRAPLGGELWYWLAIITLRTGATNIADFADEDLKLNDVAVLLILTVLLLLLTSIDLRRGGLSRRAVDLRRTDGLYWLTMLTAGVLGTALGDYTGHQVGLWIGSSVLGAGYAVLLLLRGPGGLDGKVSYWVTVVAARTTGTDWGDLLASRRGLHLGLPISTACSCAALIGLLLLWPRTPPRAIEPNTAMEGLTTAL